MRIVSLLPSATEIAIALGLGDDLVGVTFECDYPPDPRVGRRVVVGGLDTHGLDAAGIDALVREKVAAGAELYTLDSAAMGELDPDIVLTQDLCRVCALPAGAVDEAMDRLGCAAEVLTMDPHRLDEVLDSILDVGRVTDTRERAEALVASLRSRLATLTARLPAQRPRVFVLEWPDPPFGAGHWVPDVVRAGGGDPVVARSGERSVPVTWEAIAEARPDVVLVSSCGFDVDGSAAHAAQVMPRLPADCTVWAMDANGLMVRPGPRLVDGAETVAALLHGVGEVDPRSARRIR